VLTFVACFGCVARATAKKRKRVSDAAETIDHEQEEEQDEGEEESDGGDADDDSDAEAEAEPKSKRKRATTTKKAPNSSEQPAPTRVKAGAAARKGRKAGTASTNTPFDHAQVAQTTKIDNDNALFSMYFHTATPGFLAC
jgi:hypothetical protein